MAKTAGISVRHDYPESLKTDFSEQIISNSRSMISVINRSYIYEKVNLTFCKAHKSSSEAVVGKSLRDIWGQEVFENILKKNIDSCFEGNTIRYEAFFQTPGYGKKYYEVIFRPLASNTGKISHILAETFDIDDLKQLNRKADQREEELRKFETHVPVGLLRCDRSGNIIHANKAFLRLMDCMDENEILNLKLNTFFPDEDLFRLHMDQLLETNIKSFGIINLKCPRGREIPCRVSGYLGVDEFKNPVYIDFSFEDTSRELMLENRLLQAQKLETIGALAGGIAHDFNSILTTISGYSEMLQEDLPKGSDHSDKVSKIQVAVTKAKSIINQILTFSRQIEQEKVPVNVSEVLRETIGFVKSSIPPNVSMKIRIFRKDDQIYADPTQLFRVFLNLMTNAIQAMEENGGILSVKTEIVEGECLRHHLSGDIVADEYVLVTFRDTGKGMDSSHMSRIFEPFFTTREIGKGTGLGLSVIHGIISELEGDIIVTSKKNKGSVFHVYLPVMKTYTKAEDETFNKKILFITGNRYESRILSIALRNRGYDVVYISDRRNLAGMLIEENHRPDLIIYMSDSELIHRDNLARLYTKHRINIPCILIIDPEQDISGEKLLNSGINIQQLLKPVSLRELTGAIQVSLNN
ncbi:MAG: ATP-binding protein [Methanosarcina sp.]